MGTLPAGYPERVYAGVLGKIIGVYLGRPVEGWRHEQIMERLGEVTYYVNDRHDVPLKNHRLVVTDDDIEGTFTFPRALRDYPLDRLDPVAVARTWLNYLIENRTVLWWGGRGNSTEHTAYLLLRDGVLPPESGSARRNGAVVAEQVGAQIFCEGWAMACPGDPERAAGLAEQAASVSHDGAALHAARVVAALVAQSFTEPDVHRLLDVAAAQIPADSLISRVISDVREWHATGEDWQAGRKRIDERYGYHRYGGNCHVVPNHAVIIHSLLHGQGDFSRSLGIITSCGWDTDSNAGNVGCIAGVRGGLAGIDSGPDWRGPVGDRMFLPSADGGGTVTDAAREALTVAGYGRALHGLPPAEVKGGARFHFGFPGSVQGFTTTTDGPTLRNVPGHSARGQRSLAVAVPPGGAPAAAVTPTFLAPDEVEIPPYGMAASPTLYPGQELRAGAEVEGGPAYGRLVVQAYTADDQRHTLAGPEIRLVPGEGAELSWPVPDTGGQPVVAAGVSVRAADGGARTVYLDYLTWAGEPDITLSRPAGGGTMWRHAWVSAVDRFDPRWPEPYRLIQDRGTGLLMHGSRDWRDYEVTADVTPHLARSAGIAARVQGLRRYYALRLTGRDTLRLTRMLDGEEVLAEVPFPWSYGHTYRLSLAVDGHQIRGRADDVALSAADTGPGLREGGIALMVEEGRTATNAVRVRPVAQTHRELPRKEN
ncbi:MAG TPA: ADP-ribosylglycohydrolase family protein [Streptosporangiaceae bacterium]|jgi:ADP-ribosylglycohydrolase